MNIPALFDHSYHMKSLCEVLLTQVSINYDADIVYIEGQIEPNNVNIDPQFIRTPIYGPASAKAMEILLRSWIKWDTPGYEPIPKSIIAILNSDNQIVDLKCSVCKGPCDC